MTSGNDGRVIAWDVDRGAVAQHLTGHSGEVWGLDVTADGRTLVTSAADGRAIVWDLAGDRRLDRRFSVGAPLDTSARAAWYVVDVTRGVAVSPDGRLLAVAGKGGRVTLWNARTLHSAGELRGLRADAQALAFSPDGRFLAAAEALFQPPRMRVWDVRRRALTRFRSQVPAAALAFSSDGKLIAVASGNHRGADIRDARSGRLVKFVRTGELARSVAFSPDGDLLVIGLYDGGLEFFSTGDWKRIGRRIEAHSAGITHPVFTPDGRTLATAGADGTVALWNVDTQNPIGTPVTVDPGTATSAAFSPDGSKLFAVSTSGQGVRLNTSAEAWKRHACLVAGRELTPAEWDDALPGRRYQAVCSDD